MRGSRRRRAPARHRRAGTGSRRPPRACARSRGRRARHGSCPSRSSARGRRPARPRSSRGRRWGAGRCHAAPRRRRRSSAGLRPERRATGAAPASLTAWWDRRSPSAPAAHRRRRGPAAWLPGQDGGPAAKPWVPSMITGRARQRPSGRGLDVERRRRRRTPELGLQPTKAVGGGPQPLDLGAEARIVDHQPLGGRTLVAVEQVERDGRGADRPGVRAVHASPSSSGSVRRRSRPRTMRLLIVPSANPVQVAISVCERSP